MAGCEPPYYCDVETGLCVNPSSGGAHLATGIEYSEAIGVADKYATEAIEIFREYDSNADYSLYFIRVAAEDVDIVEEVNGNGVINVDIINGVGETFVKGVYRVSAHSVPPMLELYFGVSAQNTIVFTDAPEDELVGGGGSLRMLSQAANSSFKIYHRYWEFQGYPVFVADQVEDLQGLADKVNGDFGDETLYHMLGIYDGFSDVIFSLTTSYGFINGVHAGFDESVSFHRSYTDPSGVAHWVEPYSATYTSKVFNLKTTRRRDEYGLYDISMCILNNMVRLLPPSAIGLRVWANDGPGVTAVVAQHGWVEDDLHYTEIQNSIFGAEADASTVYQLALYLTGNEHRKRLFANSDFSAIANHISDQGMDPSNFVLGVFPGSITWNHTPFELWENPSFPVDTWDSFLAESKTVPQLVEGMGAGHLTPLFGVGNYWRIDNYVDENGDPNWTLYVEALNEWWRDSVVHFNSGSATYPHVHFTWGGSIQQYVDYSVGPHGGDAPMFNHMLNSVIDYVYADGVTVCFDISKNLHKFMQLCDVVRDNIKDRILSYSEFWGIDQDFIATLSGYPKRPVLLANGGNVPVVVGKAEDGTALKTYYSIKANEDGVSCAVNLTESVFDAQSLTSYYAYQEFIAINDGWGFQAYNGDGVSAFTSGLKTLHFFGKAVYVGEYGRHQKGWADSGVQYKYKISSTVFPAVFIKPSAGTACGVVKTGHLTDDMGNITSSTEWEIVVLVSPDGPAPELYCFLPPHLCPEGVDEYGFILNDAVGDELVNTRKKPLYIVANGSSAITPGSPYHHAVFNQPYGDNGNADFTVENSNFYEHGAEVPVVSQMFMAVSMAMCEREGQFTYTYTYTENYFLAERVTVTVTNYLYWAFYRSVFRLTAEGLEATWGTYAADVYTKSQSDSGWSVLGFDIGFLGGSSNTVGGIRPITNATINQGSFPFLIADSRPYD